MCQEPGAANGVAGAGLGDGAEREFVPSVDLRHGCLLTMVRTELSSVGSFC